MENHESYLVKTLVFDFAKAIFSNVAKSLFYIERIIDGLLLLVHALTTGRLPSGKLPAWGSGIESANRAFGQTRSLGPIEYLCAWYAQPTGSKPLSANAFYRLAYTLISLISVESKAKMLYCAKLRADVEDPVEGALAQSTRQALSEMIHTWEAGAPSEEVILCFQNSLHGGGLSQLATHPSPFLR